MRIRIKLKGKINRNKHMQILYYVLTVFKRVVRLLFAFRACRLEDLGNLRFVTLEDLTRRVVCGDPFNAIRFKVFRFVAIK